MLIQIPLQQRAPLPQAALAEAATEAVLGAGVQPPPPLQQAAAGLPHLPGPLPCQLGPATWSVVHNMFLELSRNCRVNFQVPLTALIVLYHYCWFSLYEGVLGVRLPLPELLLPLIRSLAPASCNNTVDTAALQVGTWLGLQTLQGPHLVHEHGGGDGYPVIGGIGAVTANK